MYKAYSAIFSGFQSPLLTNVYLLIIKFNTFENQSKLHILVRNYNETTYMEGESITPLKCAAIQFLSSSGKDSRK